MDTINILGRPYHTAERTTIRQDRTLELVLKEVGTFEKKNDETDEDLIARVFATLIDGDAWARLIACRLVPVGERWSPELQAVTVAALEQMDDPEEKKAVVSLIGWVIASFFVVGAFSQTASRVYSNAVGEGVLDNTMKTAKIPSLRGATWFVRLLAATLYGLRTFWTVLWTKPAPAISQS